MSDRLTIGCFWLVLLFVTYSAFAPPDMVTAPRVSDIVLHALAFFVLTGLLQMAHLPQRPWLAAAWLLAYGALIEIVQMALPARSAELKDLMVDAAGIAAGLLAFRWLGQSATRLLRSWVD